MLSALKDKSPLDAQWCARGVANNTARGTINDRGYGMKTRLARDLTESNETHSHALVLLEPRAKPLDARAVSSTVDRAIEQATRDLTEFRHLDCGVGDSSLDTRIRVARSRMRDVVRAMTRAEKYDHARAWNATVLTIDYAISALRDLRDASIDAAEGEVQRDR